jgi:hypothetical protein
MTWCHHDQARDLVETWNGLPSRQRVVDCFPAQEDGQSGCELQRYTNIAEVAYISSQVDMEEGLANARCKMGYSVQSRCCQCSCSLLMSKY